jgi:hypothetical protein
VQLFNLILIYFCFCFNIAFPSVFISHLINKTDQTVKLFFSTEKRENIGISMKRSILTGDNQDNALSSYDNGNRTTFVSIPPKTLVSLSGAQIPLNYSDSYPKIAIQIGFGDQSNPVYLSQNSGGKGISFIIIQREKYIEEFKTTLIYSGSYSISKRVKHAEGLLQAGEKFILEINSPDSLSIYPWKEEIIKEYTNPNKLQAQELLHKAIMNDAAEDIIEAIKLGANINLGVGNQAPILIALMMNKATAFRELLNSGANVNIRYQNDPLVLYFIKTVQLDRALSLFNKGLILSEKDKSDIINYLMRTPWNASFLNFYFEILKNVGYDFKVGFTEKDLSKNQWFSFLKNIANSSNSYGNAILHGLGLFIEYGANPNQIFYLDEGLSWTPIFTIFNSYLKSNIASRLWGGMADLISDMLIKGANIDLLFKAQGSSKEDTLLSYALNFYEGPTLTPSTQEELFNFLLDKGASLELAMDLYLKNGGFPNKKNLLNWVVRKNKPKVVQQLINAGAYKTREDLELAIKNGFGEIINILWTN